MALPLLDLSSLPTETQNKLLRHAGAVLDIGGELRPIGSDLDLSALSAAERAALAEVNRTGPRKIPTPEQWIEAQQGPAAQAMPRDQFERLSPAAKMAHLKGGGTLKDA